jgi:uncharacterized protein YjbJ (UPF0337 family)
MTTPAQDKTEGKIDDTKGRAKVAAGELTGDEQLKAEGLQDRASGAVKRVAGEAKSMIDGAVDAVTKRVKGA